jgi:membrane fusion protein (multidrug efflux system)
VSDAPIPLFRKEAIDFQRSRGMHAEMVAIDPAETSWGFRLLCAGMLALAAFLGLGLLNEYATGPAFVRLDGGTTLTASLAGLVTKVEVAPGDKVEEGDVLVRFFSSEEVAQEQAASKEFESQLAKLLLRPDDAATREALVSLRSRRELARTKLEQRTLRAPHKGVVGDVRVREGQMVEPGLRVLDLARTASEATVIALMPGRYRPLLHSGDKLRFEIDGFHQRARELTVERVGEQIVGPAEATRYLGRDLSDALPVKGPVVLVQAKLDKTSFDADGQRYDFAAGMYGKAEVAVRTEPLIYAFVPSLKQWADHVHLGTGGH